MNFVSFHPIYLWCRVIQRVGHFLAKRSNVVIATNLHHKRKIEQDLDFGKTWGLCSQPPSDSISISRSPTRHSVEAEAQVPTHARSCQAGASSVWLLMDMAIAT
jgi:hypothetical protein